MNNKIRKAVFPVAGLGTRFLPATKAVAKEMLPILNKPLIQYAVEEAVCAGIKELIFVTSKNKTVIADHFAHASSLEQQLEHQEKQSLLAIVREIIPSDVRCIYIHQEKRLGLGHAVHCARDIVGNEPFAVLLPDDFIHAGTPVLSQMMTVFNQHSAMVLAMEEVPESQVTRYGILSGNWHNEQLFAISGMVEKPSIIDATSRLAVVGRYILTAKVFDVLSKTLPDQRGEIQLTTALASMLPLEKIWGYRFEGVRFDCGIPLGLVQANVLLASQSEDMRHEFIAYLRNVLDSQKHY